MKRKAKRTGEWRDYRTGDPVARRIRGLHAADSRRQARIDGGAGVMTTPDGRRVYWAD